MMDRTSPTKAPSRRRKCPICAEPAAVDFRPFCSRRCADLDLGKWLDGSYRIPAVEPPDGAAGEEAAAEENEHPSSRGQRPE